MRNTDQRTKAALLGARRLQQKQAKRRLQAVMAGCYAMSISIVVTLTCVIASFDGTALKTSTYDPAGVYAGSLFVDSFFGYITVAAFSFILGVCATVLCVLLHRKYQEEGEARGD